MVAIFMGNFLKNSIQNYIRPEAMPFQFISTYIAPRLWWTFYNSGRRIRQALFSCPVNLVNIFLLKILLNMTWYCLHILFLLQCSENLIFKLLRKVSLGDSVFVRFFVSFLDMQYPHFPATHCWKHRIKNYPTH